MKYTIYNLSKKEVDLLYEMVNSHITWGEGGCLINDNGKASLTKIKIAQGILKKI